MLHQYLKAVDSHTQQFSSFVAPTETPFLEGQIIQAAQRSIRIIFVYQFGSLAEEIFRQENHDTTDMRTSIRIQYIFSVFRDEGKRIMEQLGLLPDSNVITAAVVGESDLEIEMPTTLLVAQMSHEETPLPCSQEDVQELIDAALSEGMEIYKRELLKKTQEMSSWN